MAGLLLVLGLVLQNRATADGYVTDPLTAQMIVFTPEEKLTDEEKQAPGSGGVSLPPGR